MNEQVLQRIDALAARLGVVGEHLWAVLVRQVYVDAVMTCVWAAVFVPSFVFAVRRYVARKKAVAGRFDDLEPIPEIGLAVLGVVALVVAILAVNAVVVAVVNPEYAALSKILSIGD